MTSSDRLHTFDGLTNFRDFGGYSAGDRRMVTGRFFRSANHALASDADLARLAAMGIAAVVDLRRPVERERSPSRRWEGFAASVVENDDHDEGSEFVGQLHGGLGHEGQVLSAVPAALL